MTATNVNPNVDAKAETENAVKTEFQTVMADTTIVSDKLFLKYMGAVDTQQKAVGGKWAQLIEHCKDNAHLLAHLGKEYKELTQAEKDELAKGKAIILKSLGDMGKTESSAQSIRSYIIKMCKPEQAEALAKLKTGEITVRASREIGRKPQSNPSQGRSDATRYAEGIDTAVRYAIAQGFDTVRVYADVAAKFAEYESRKQDGAAKAEKAAKDKEEMQTAIKETEKELAAKK